MDTWFPCVPLRLLSPGSDSSGFRDSAAASCVIPFFSSWLLEYLEWIQASISFLSCENNYQRIRGIARMVTMSEELGSRAFRLNEEVAPLRRLRSFRRFVALTQRDPPGG